MSPRLSLTESFSIFFLLLFLLCIILARCTQVSHGVLRLFFCNYVTALLCFVFRSRQVSCISYRPQTQGNLVARYSLSVFLNSFVFQMFLYTRSFHQEDQNFKVIGRSLCPSACGLSPNHHLVH